MGRASQIQNPGAGRNRPLGISEQAGDSRRLWSWGEARASKASFTSEGGNAPCRPLFRGLVKIEHAGVPKRSNLRGMASETEILTDEEFASLLLIGNLPVNGRPPPVPAAHSDRLIALGYMVHLSGRLRMTTQGRVRIYAKQLTNG